VASLGSGTDVLAPEVWEVEVPLYEYSCPSCGERFELLQRVGQGAAGVRCPRCAGEVVKEFSTFAGAASGAGSGGTGCSPSGRFT
jgi:putative FmdB family regulatory protein